MVPYETMGPGLHRRWTARVPGRPEWSPEVGDWLRGPDSPRRARVPVGAGEMRLPVKCVQLSTFRQEIGSCFFSYLDSREKSLAGTRGASVLCRAHGGLRAAADLNVSASEGARP